MTMENNIYKIQKPKKMHNFKKSIKKLTILYMTFFAFITLLRVNYALPIDQGKPLLYPFDKL